MADIWTLTENEKDHVAERLNDARRLYASGDPQFWRGGQPEERFAEALADFGPEETAFAISLVQQDIARLEERGPDRVLETIDAFEEALEVKRRFDRGKIDKDAARRELREIDQANGGAISEEWDFEEES